MGCCGPSTTHVDCEPIRGLDEIEPPVRWTHARVDDRLQQPVRLEIKFTGANLDGLRADWQWLDAQAMHMREDGTPIDHLLQL